MNEKKPIDLKRNSAGSAEIGTKEEGAILDMPKIGERLLVIKEKAVFEFMFADNIDPKRTNINLPNNIQKQILNKGADSEIVSRTLLNSIISFSAFNFEYIFLIFIIYENIISFLSLRFSQAVSSF